MLQIQRRLEEDVAGPTPGRRSDRFAARRYAKTLVPRYPIDSFARMHEMWLDR